MEADPLPGDPLDRLAPVGIDVVAQQELDERLLPTLIERVRKPVPIVHVRLLERPAVHRADHDQSRDPLGVLERVGDGRVRAHRVAGEQKRLIPDLLSDDLLEVGDELRVSITIARRGGIRLPVAASVVGDLPQAAAREAAGAVDDVAARRGEAVQQHGRPSLPQRLAVQLGRGPGGERLRLRSAQPSSISTDSIVTSRVGCSVGVPSSPISSTTSSPR